ncbi:Parathyroid hormone-related protein-like protein [Aix galericulata]|nr:Parathyroid hormone-related protein-like protein [Aix galericulata]
MAGRGFSSVAGTRKPHFSSKRAVTEHQLMHDKGRAFQGLKRLMWLYNALGSVHTASSRAISLSDAMWDSQKSQDLYDSIGRDEASSLTKQLLELRGNEQDFPLLKKLDLPQYLKTPKGNWNPQDIFDLLQIKELVQEAEALVCQHICLVMPHPCGHYMVM